MGANDDVRVCRDCCGDGKRLLPWDDKYIQCNTCGGSGKLATPAAQPAMDGDAAMTPFDRCEFALRDAGFDYDEAFRIAYLAYPSQPSAPDGSTDSVEIGSKSVDGPEGGEQLPDDWAATPEQINALPEKLRHWVMWLQTSADPAGTIQQNWRLEQENAALRILVSQCRSARVDDEDTKRLDYIERTFSGMTNRERYLPVQMIWGKGCNGRTLREACDKYMLKEKS